jgi:hypothetical protein
LTGLSHSNESVEFGIEDEEDDDEDEDEEDDEDEGVDDDDKPFVCFKSNEFELKLTMLELVELVETPLLTLPQVGDVELFN